MAEICRGNRGNVVGLLPASETRDLSNDDIIRKYYCIHFPHKLSPSIRKLATQHQPTVDVLATIISPNVKMMQTMMFMKGPNSPGQNWHQDEYYIPTRDASLTGTWVAVERAEIENGCLWVIPGSHKRRVIYPTRDHGKPQEFDPTPVAINYPYDEAKDAIPCVLNPGDAIFFNGYLLHRSLRNNTKSRTRLSFANHYMSAESLLPWNCDGKVKGYVEDMRDIELVCGEDPYAWKGKENCVGCIPYVRGSLAWKPPSA